MFIFPAIDIKDGTCVRLYQGSFETVHKVANDPLKMAQAFEAAGAKWVHMVDLDGAIQGKEVNGKIFTKIAKNTSLRVQVGGGIRSLEQIDAYLERGIDRIVLGSIALSEPEMVSEAVRMYGDAVAVGIDAKDGFAQGEGWLKDSKRHYLDVAKEMVDLGVTTLIYTNIRQDGTLLGPAVEDYRVLCENFPHTDIIASGGVRNVDDIIQLKELGLEGVICGKGIYAGTLDLVKAVKIAKGV